MVLQYAYLEPEHLSNAAARIELEWDVVTNEVTISLRWKNKGLTLSDKPLFSNARPERLELPTLGFEGRCSIQLSYGRIVQYCVSQILLARCSSALRCTMLASTLRVSAPATRR